MYSEVDISLIKYKHVGQVGTSANHKAWWVEGTQVLAFPKVRGGGVI